MGDPTSQTTPANVQVALQFSEQGFCNSGLCMLLPEVHEFSDFSYTLMGFKNTILCTLVG